MGNHDAIVNQNGERKKSVAHISQTDKNHANGLGVYWCPVQRTTILTCKCVLINWFKFTIGPCVIVPIRVGIIRRRANVVVIG